MKRLTNMATIKKETDSKSKAVKTSGTKAPSKSKVDKKAPVKKAAEPVKPVKKAKVPAAKTTKSAAPVKAPAKKASPSTSQGGGIKIPKPKDVKETNRLLQDVAKPIVQATSKYGNATNVYGSDKEVVTTTHKSTPSLVTPRKG
jgi:hypothetical protein